MITRLLVANRGEIARRVFRTCRTAGIETVAVFSDADSASPHVAEADQAVRLSGPAPYLSVSALLEACRLSGADAVHPGYGFLSENASFAQAVLDAGLVWVGPSPSAIAAMGDKIAAKALMAAASVPLLPSWTPEDLPSEPSFPLLVKAAKGGGGRGMRVVRSRADLPTEVAAARREAEAAFGDGTVFVEPLLERARHIEVQILADRHGTIWTLGERECSIQRRHQKVIEEAPSPGITDEVRQRLFEAARRAAREISYEGAGTVEFLVKDDTVAFLEMNTRLQVEHPVTEAVYGLDLVELQLRIAEGEALPPAPPEPSGHAIEVRLYAEDRDFLPQSGPIHRFEISGEVRVDAGVESGSVVSTLYDPMLAKVIAYGSSRTQARRRLIRALTTARLHGITTNRDLLLDVLKNRDFAEGDTHTGFLTTLPAARDVPLELPALAAALATAAANRARARTLASLPAGWRNVRSQPRTARFEEIEVVYDPLPEEVTVINATPTRVILERRGLRHTFHVSTYGGTVHVDSALGSLRLTALPRLPEPVVEVAPGSLLAPMPGSVLRVEVARGDQVAGGQVVVVIEAMKMEHQIVAPADGVVSEVAVEKGRQVEAGEVLAVISQGISHGISPNGPQSISEGDKA